jgi:Mrp family chromosome partitioning ATPase
VPLERHDLSSLETYLQIVQRRKWVIIQAVLVVSLAAAAVSILQKPRYEASSQVLVGNRDAAATVIGGATTVSRPERVIETQAQLARVPAMADRVIEASNVQDMTAQEFLNASRVTADDDSDLLIFSVTAANPMLAIRLANEYGSQVTAYRQKLTVDALRRARGEIAEQIRLVLDSHGRDSLLYESLVDKEAALRSAEALEASNASVVQRADHAEQVEPRPARNVLFGLALGVVAGVGLALLFEALDTRVRSTFEVAERLAVPLLGSGTKLPRRPRRKDRLIMLEDPDGMEGEIFRSIAMTLAFASRNRRVRAIMVTSATRGEGKSTTVANLAIALARAGQDVFVVDLDLRRPSIARLFDLEEATGVADLAVGHAGLTEALPVVQVPKSRWDGAARERQGAVAQGALRVLPAGPIPANVGELVHTSVLARVLDAVPEQTDLVLIDSPPVLEVSDALVLSAAADALVVVAGLGVIRRFELDELRRVLPTAPAETLGFIATAPATGPDPRTRAARRSDGSALPKRVSLTHDEGSTRGELYAEARRLEIRGRSKMSKSQLARAVGRQRELLAATGTDSERERQDSGVNETRSANPRGAPPPGGETEDWEDTTREATTERVGRTAP